MSSKVTISGRSLLFGTRGVVDTMSLLAGRADELRRLAICTDSEAAAGELSQCRADELRARMRDLAKLCHDVGKELVFARSLIEATLMT